MRLPPILCAVILLAPLAPLPAQTAADSAAIRATALDYVEGWYAGDGDRVARAVHPELVKRIVVTDTATGRRFVQTMGSSALVNGARRGFGRATPEDRRRRDVAILDIFASAASVRTAMADWVDYLQMARFEGRWLIVNVLWERVPGGG
jgi:hypothetical protein